jgi:hypothetical protein
MLKWRMTNWRLWLYRGLVTCVCGLIIYSFAVPWWTARVSVCPEYNAIRIYGWGLRHSLIQLREYIIADETPIYQTVLAWLGISILAVLSLFSTWLKHSRGRWLLGGLGISYIAYTIVAVQIVIKGRLHQMGITLTGWSAFRGEGGTADIQAFLKSSIYLAIGAGIALVLLALLRNLITGEKTGDKNHTASPTIITKE